MKIAVPQVERMFMGEYHGTPPVNMIREAIPVRMGQGAVFTLI